MELELGLEGLFFSREYEAVVFYRDQPLRKHRLDLVVANAIVVELKAVERLQRIHQMQLLSYMKTAQLKAGLLMNFHADYLKTQLRRFVL